MPILALKSLKKWKGKWKGEEEEGEKEPPPEPLVKPLAEPKYKVVLVRDKECVRLWSRFYELLFKLKAKHINFAS